MESVAFLTDEILVSGPHVGMHNIIYWKILKIMIKGGPVNKINMDGKML